MENKVSPSLPLPCHPPSDGAESLLNGGVGHSETVSFFTAVPFVPESWPKALKRLSLQTKTTSFLPSRCWGEKGGMSFSQDGRMEPFGAAPDTEDAIVSESWKVLTSSLISPWLSWEPRGSYEELPPLNSEHQLGLA